MSRRIVRWRAAAGCAAVVLAVAGCSSSSADGPGTTTGSAGLSASVISVPSTGSGASGSNSPTAPTPSVIDVPTVVATPTSLDPDAQEASDRAAVEAQWVKFWDIYINIVRTPSLDRDALAATVAIDPMHSNLLKSAEYFESQGKDNYGTVGHRLSWLDGIHGSSEVVLSDCQDQSQFGSLEVASGHKLTVGVERDNVKGEFVRGQDGVWRVHELYYLTDTPC